MITKLLLTIPVDIHQINNFQSASYFDRKSLHIIVKTGTNRWNESMLERMKMNVNKFNLSMLIR